MGVSSPVIDAVSTQHQKPSTVLLKASHIGGWVQLSSHANLHCRVAVLYPRLLFRTKASAKSFEYSILTVRSGVEIKLNLMNRCRFNKTRAIRYCTFLRNAKKTIIRRLFIRGWNKGVSGRRDYTRGHDRPSQWTAMARYGRKSIYIVYII